MALWYCPSCTAGYAVGLAACPQCGATDHEEEPPVAKINREGPSYEPGKNPNGEPETPAAAQPQAAGEPGPQLATPPQAADGAPNEPETETPPLPPQHE